MTQAVRPFMVPNTQSDFLRLPSHAAPSRLPLALAFAYACFFLFAKQAFCNYYYFEGVLILSAAALLEPARIAHPGQAAGVTGAAQGLASGQQPAVG